MRKSMLIFRHELTKTITTGWFIVMSVAVPLVALLGVEIYGYVQTASKPAATEVSTVGYVDQVGGFGGFTRQGSLVLMRYDTVDEAARALTQGSIGEYFVIPPDYISSGIVPRYTLKRQLVAPEDTSAAISAFLVDNLLAEAVPPAVVARVSAPLNLVTIAVTETGAVAPDQGGVSTLIIPMAFAILLVFSLSFASSQMILSLGQEKENRLMEILLSSVSTRQLLVGKVLGLAVAGLVQVVVWVVTLPLLLDAASSVVGGFFTTLRIPTGFLALAVAYFVLAYLLFAVLMACIGAISPTVNEGQQLSGLLILLIVAPVWFSSLLMFNPNHPLSVALTIFPVSAPTVVMVRIGATDVPAWQISTSIALLLLSTIGGLLLAAHLFRRYLLEYGKRPSFREVLGSLKG